MEYRNRRLISMAKIRGEFCCYWCLQGRLKKSSADCLLNVVLTVSFEFSNEVPKLFFFVLMIMTPIWFLI